MNYFAQSAFENIRKKVQRLRENGVSHSRMIMTTSAMPPDVAIDLARLLDEFVMNDGRIYLTFKAAKNLVDEWRGTDEVVLEELEHRGWLDDTGNLTGYRNAPPPEDGYLGLSVLVGADKVMDSSSLADFYQCNTDVVLQEEMKGSFSSWTRKRLDKAHVAYDESNIRLYDIVLSAVVEQGCADLFQIAQLLRDLPLELIGAQDGRDAEIALLRGLRDIGLPNLIGFLSNKRKKLAPYLETAIRFFQYDLYIEAAAVNKALKSIDQLMAVKTEEIESNQLFKAEVRGRFGTDSEFIEAVRKYVQSEDKLIREMLYDSDFITICDKILKFKVKTPPPSKETVHGLSGGPIEVALTALWKTLKDFKKKYTDEMRGITIEGR